METINVGKRIKEKRKERKMTARELAEKAGISPSLLSQIEKGVVTPSINTLRMIAHALDIPVFTLFITEEVPDTMVVRKNNRKTITNPSMNQVTYELLSPDLSGDIEFALMRLSPKTSSSEKLLSHSGEEVAYVLKGEMLLCLENEEIHLEMSDSVRIAPYKKHKWFNPGDSESEIIFSITPPTF